jgi:hypothetical protein
METSSSVLRRRRLRNVSQDSAYISKSRAGIPESTRDGAPRLHIFFSVAVLKELLRDMHIFLRDEAA